MPSEMVMGDESGDESGVDSRQSTVGSWGGLSEREL